MTAFLQCLKSPEWKKRKGLKCCLSSEFTPYMWYLSEHAPSVGYSKVQSPKLSYYSTLHKFFINIYQHLGLLNFVISDLQTYCKYKCTKAVPPLPWALSSLFSIPVRLHTGKKKRKTGSLASLDRDLDRKFPAPSFPTISHLSLQGIWFPFLLSLSLTIKHNSN